MKSFTLLVLSAIIGMGEVAAGETVKWKYPLDVPAGSPTLFPNEAAPTGIVVTAGKTVIRLNGDGSLVWKLEEPAPIATPATVADIDGDGTPEILFATSDGTVFCIDANKGLRWTHAFNTPAGGFKALVAADLTPSRGMEILAGFDDGWLNCLSADGTLLWRFFGDKFRVGGIAVACVDNDNAPEVVYGTDNGHVYCLDAFGRIEWRYNELAPYGRSGPNLTDLDKDGKPELLITRSNVGNATCLMALDASAGKCLWRTRDVMQGYFSNAVADFDGDGLLEVVHGDKGNHLYCENADGARRWDVELGGRGVFWAPCVADVDGDGQLEVIAGVRGNDPRTGACVYVVGADGKVKSALKLGSGANVSPAVGDIDGDGRLEVVVAAEGPNQVQALTWNAAGRVAWSSLRGASTMTANANVPICEPAGHGRAAAPYALDDLIPKGDLRIETGDVTWGDNTWSVSWEDPVHENAFIEVAVIAPGASDETRVVDLKSGATAARIPVDLAHGGAATVVVRLHEPDTTVPALVAVREVTPPAPGFCHYDQVGAACKAAVEAGEAAQADTAGLRARLALLRAKQEAVTESVNAGSPGPKVAEDATRLRANAATIEALARLLAGYWGAGGKGSFVYWPDPNPWDPFDPKAVPESLNLGVPVTVQAYGDEFEDVALTLRNIGAESFPVRCAFTAPTAGQTRPVEPDPAKHVKLHAVVPVPSRLSGRVFDALPELDLSRTLMLSPDEARQLWLVVDTHGLEPGTHALTLYLAGLTNPMTVHAVPLRIEVWPVRLPHDVYAKMNWSSFNPGDTSDQAARDMIDHGVSVIYGPPLPAIPVDAEGSRNGDVDWTAFDQALARVPTYFTLLWSGPPACKWPEEHSPKEDGDPYFAGFKLAVHELAAHLAAKDFDYHHWAFYPIDEPWNTGFTEVPHLKRFCGMVKRADPDAQVYADPAGLVRVEYLDEFKGLIDIWQPEMNLLKRDPKLVAWFRANAKRFWAYEAPGPAKDLLPLGHYRAFAWLAWRFGTEGAGYWVYRGEDNWGPPPDTDYSAVYQANDQVIPSRRWEADRDGVEDYRALYLLRREIEKARADGRIADADHAQALIDEAVAAVVGWQVGVIDEITRMTRDYEIDYGKLMTYRGRIAEEIMKLRGVRPVKK